MQTVLRQSILLLLLCVLMGVAALIWLSTTNMEVDAPFIALTVIQCLVVLASLLAESRLKSRVIWIAELLILITLMPMLSGRLLDLVPSGDWRPLNDPPAPIVKFVGSSPITFFGGDIYGEDKSSNRYMHRCDQDGCRWLATADPMPNIDRSSYWSGACGGKLVRASDRYLPLSPGQIQARFDTRYCGPDYAMDYYFISTTDGKVWVWATQAYGMDASARHYQVLVFLAIIGLLFWLCLRLTKSIIRTNRM